MRVAGTTTGFLVVEPRGAEPRSSLDGTMIWMPTDLERSSRLTGKAAARVGAYADVGRLRSQCDSSATTAEGASPDKRIDIAQDPADESSHTERGEG